MSQCVVYSLSYVKEVIHLFQGVHSITWEFCKMMRYYIILPNYKNHLVKLKLLPLMYTYESSHILFLKSIKSPNNS